MIYDGTFCIGQSQVTQLTGKHTPDSCFQSITSLSVYGYVS